MGTMPRGFGRLPFFSRVVAGDRAPSDQSALEGAPIDPDAAPVGPLTLLPAMIYRQVLFDSTEITPAWARSRPEAVLSKEKAPTSKATRPKEPDAKTAEPKPAATRRARGPSSGRRSNQ